MPAVAAIFQIYAPDTEAKQELDLFLAGARCGFPSPAEEYVECRLDINSYLIKHPAATFYVRADGDSMQRAGIFSGDLLVVDRSLSPRPGNVVIAIVNGGFTVKRLKIIHGQNCLAPENDE